MLHILISCVLFMIIIVLIYYVNEIQPKYNYWKKRGVKGPQPLPIFGNYKSVILKQQTEAMLLREIYEEYSDERFIGLYKGVNPILLVNDPELIKYVGITHFKNFQSRCFYEPLTYFDKSIFVIEGGKGWQCIRQLLLPVFTSFKLIKFIQKANYVLDSYITFLSRLFTTEDKININHYQTKCNINFIYNMILGTDIDCFKEFNKFEEVFVGLSEPAMYFNYIYVLSMVFPSLLNFISPLLRLMVKINYLSYRKVCNDIKQSKQLNGAILDYLHEMQNKDDGEKYFKINDQLIDQQIISLSLAFEAIAESLGNMITEMTLRQTVQDKCYEEVTQVLKKYNNEYNYESILEMKYLRMTFYETLRKYNTSHKIERKCTEACVLPGTELKVEEGIHVYISTHGLHYDPRYFKNPESFEPERFINFKKRDIPQNMLLSFGIGPRRCIGERMTELIITLTVARLLQNFKFLPCDQTKMEPTYRVDKILMLTRDKNVLGVQKR